MANLIRAGLNVAGARLPLYTGGQSLAGFSLAGTWVGTVGFQYSTDGVNFKDLFVTPFPSGTAVKSATANGNWLARNLNAVAVQLNLSALTSGSVLATIAASTDASAQDAFLASTSKYISQSVSGGATNVITVAAQANRAWRLRSLSVGGSIAASAAVDVKVTDGASSVLWEGYVPPSLNGISGGGSFLLPLPPPDPSSPNSGGVVGTPGNSMVITLAAPGGSVVSTVNAELVTD